MDDSICVCNNELYAYTAGEVPATVQKWEAPAEGKTDMLMLCAHGDDDQIFFAGVLPAVSGFAALR